MAIEVASDLRHHHRRPEGVPLVVAGNLRRLELGALSVFNLIDAEVVLQQVVPRNVVILRVLGPPDQGDRKGDTGEWH